MYKTWPAFKVHFARTFKETRDSNETAVNSGYANLVRQMQTDMQTISNENVHALVNYTNKSAADTNTIETLKEKIIYMKAAQTVANKTNLLSQVKSEIRGKIIPAAIIDKEDDII